MLQTLVERGWDLSRGLCVSTDTRSLPAGCIFFALHGETFNGNQFAATALSQGAALAVVDEEAYWTDGCILVDNTLLALQTLAREWREYLGTTIIGISGTNGKTTTKELLATVLKTRYNLLYTQGNLNNSIGVPLTLLQLRKEHTLAIVEMGASHIGDLQELVDIAEPNCGLLTNVGKAHLLGFGSFEGVKQAKKELYDYLRLHDGFIFRNIDNPYLQAMAGDLRTKSYSLQDTNAEVYGKVLPSSAYLKMEITAMGQSGTLQTQLVGGYNAENVLAAVRVGLHFGVSLQEAIQALAVYSPTNHRSMLKQTDANHLILDVYNANPTSMHASVLSFMQMDVPREEKCFILGDMLELNEDSHLEHQNIVNLLTEQKYEQVWLVGKEFSSTTAVYPTFETVDELLAVLKEHPLTHKYILLKASHGIHLEKLIDIL